MNAGVVLSLRGIIVVPNLTLFILLPQGDISIDQAHRGYDVTYDETGKAWVNPF